MRVRIIEFWVGVFVLCGAVALLMLALQVSGLSLIKKDAGYQVTAVFDNIGDLKVRSAVAMSGVKIGTVSNVYLDPQTFRAVVTLKINSEENHIPKDSSASIYTEGLLGSNYVSLTPGFETEVLKEGSTITDTHSALILENLIGQLMFKLTNDDGHKTDAAPSAAAATPTAGPETTAPASPATSSPKQEVAP